jgi:thiamine biosynthesis protein ThiI
MVKIIVRYAEIGLKGKNRSVFENQLVKNIIRSLNLNRSQVQLRQKQIILTVKSNLINQSIVKLQQVFGIAWFAPVYETATNLEEISKIAVKLAEKSRSFAVRATRADKNLPFTSQDIAVKVGDRVRKAVNAKVDLKNPQTTIYITANSDKTYLYSEKIPGPGGLPVGTSGKVLSLLSGGFDSIISSYLMAKRGAQVDFLHFHVFPDSAKVLTTKIKTIVDRLSQSTFSEKLFLAGYSPFQMAVLGLKTRQAKYELVVFRRLMVKVAEKLAQKYNYQALVLGDSLGQVASQTMDNIIAVDQAVEIPIFRPLIGLDKIEIIDLVKKLNLEKTTNLPYKDCCSIISTHPATKANPEKIRLIEKNINSDKIISAIVKNISLVNL